MKCQACKNSAGNYLLWNQAPRYEICLYLRGVKTLSVTDSEKNFFYRNHSDENKKTRHALKD